MMTTPTKTLTAANSDRFSLEQPEDTRISPEAIKVIEAYAGQVELVSPGASMVVFRMPKALSLHARLSAQAAIVRACGCPVGTSVKHIGEPAFAPEGA